MFDPGSAAAAMAGPAYVAWRKQICLGLLLHALCSHVQAFRLATNPRLQALTHVSCPLNTRSLHPTDIRSALGTSGFVKRSVRALSEMVGRRTRIQAASGVGDEAEQELLTKLLKGELEISSLGLAAEDEAELRKLLPGLASGGDSRLETELTIQKPQDKDEIRPVLPFGVPDGAPQTAGKTGEVAMWTASPAAFDLRATSAPEAWAEEIGAHTSAIYIHNVLTKVECEAFLAVTEEMGFQEHDLTKNFHAAVTWVAHLDAVIVPLFERIRAFLPSEIHVNGVLRRATGLNARLRIYRYQPDGRQTFRPHMDDSFPMSECVDDRLIWDSSQGQLASVFTFLLYLTDEFDGGETTFFEYGHQDWDAALASVGPQVAAVKPVAGSVLVFPQTCRTEPLDEDEDTGVLPARTGELAEHSETWIAPYHEGSLVRPIRGGRPKYVVRSDVMYSFGGPQAPSWPAS